MRLLLFDIDGTLTWGGPAKGAFQLALETVFGTAGPIDDHDFSGKTDPQIVRELMIRAGLSSEEVDAGFEPFRLQYLAEFERRIGGSPVKVLPGVLDLIPLLAELQGVALGLVTGNFERGAHLKLGSAGLSHFFPVGGFGSDHEVRNELPPVALQRAKAHWGRPFGGDDAVIIGDTPRDIACGKAVGALTVAVATGRFSEGELSASGADVVLSDLSETDRVVQCLTATSS